MRGGRRGWGRVWGVVRVWFEGEMRGIERGIEGGVGVGGGGVTPRTSPKRNQPVTLQINLLIDTSPRKQCWYHRKTEYHSNRDLFIIE